MSINFKDKEMIVNDVIERLKPKLPENTDFEQGVLRDIIEAFMEEIDYQYWQLKQVYDINIDDAVGNDLDEYVAILGVKRIDATKSKGSVVFYRSTPAQNDYFIPAGTLVETLKNQDNISVKFQTLKDVTLRAGNLEVSVDVECLEDGEIGNITMSSIRTINNPPFGIESVKNTEYFSGGAEKESDDSLRDRAKHILDSKGMATIDALKYKISTISGVRKVLVLDMQRGIGTVDILIMGDVTPLPQNKVDEINNAIFETKAGGIDVLFYEPELLSVDINLKLVLGAGYIVSDVQEKVEEAIKKYVNNLDIGQTLILNQLERSVLNSSENILDVIVNYPNGNISAEYNEVIRVNSISIE